jgi:class 3 adenylate cyclase
MTRSGRPGSHCTCMNLRFSGRRGYDSLSAQSRAGVTEMADVERRLVAIFAADLEGYSRLMGKDEVATLDALTVRREILDGLRTQRWITT